MLLFQTENRKRKPRRFSLIRFRLLIVQTEVCCLPVCLRRNKRKLSVCKQTNYIHTHVHVHVHVYIHIHCHVHVS